MTTVYGAPYNEAPTIPIIGQQPTPPANDIPYASPVQNMPDIPELGGLRANYPKTSFAYDFGATFAFRRGILETVYGDENGDIPSYDGDVWTVQLTARPGYYVEPELLYRYGLTPTSGIPFG